MKIYQHDEAGVYTGSHELVEGATLPEHFENCVEVAPPEVGEGFLCRWNGEDWTIEIARPLISY